ncbi:MAG: hypothetical protein ACETVX_03515, partial [bacterium]
PETQISPPDSGLHWDVNIVVDNNGRPHIVWDEAWYSEYVYYATKTDTGWSITHVNNPSSVRAGPWCCPSIDIDDSGYIYIVWTGVKQGDSDRDVFLVKGDGRIWNEPIQINQDDNYNEYYAFVAAKSSNDIWVSWTKEFSFWVTHVYVSHFDGMGWSQEERLDTSPPSCNGVGIIKLDARDLPWVVWEGIDTSSTFAGSEIYYNRYLSSGIIEEGGRKNRDSHSVLYVRPNPISDRATISYTLTKPSFVKLEIFDVQGRKVSTLIESFKQAGNYRMLWDTSLKNQKGCLSAKIFFCRFQAEGKIKTLKVVFKKR